MESVDAELRRRMDGIESRSAVLELMAGSCHGADRRDPDRFAALWHPDAVWDVGVARFEGRPQIMEAFARQWESFRSMHHVTSNSVVGGGDESTG